MIRLIKDQIYWIGVIDHELDVFDVVMETKYGTSYNSYLVKTEHHNILVETVKVKFFDEYLSNINELVGIDNIDAIIVNHTEPDHAGSIEKLLKLNPNIKIIGSKAAISYLFDITNMEFESKVVRPNEEISYDDQTFQFISVPFLHWPDSIYTYLNNEKMLFTCDSFGTHYAHDHVFLSELKEEQREDYLEAFRYYYDAIFAPYKKFVQQAIEKIKDLDIDYILNGHGPLLDQNIHFYLDTYKEWSSDVNDGSKLVVMINASSYGYTVEMSECIKEGILSVDNSIYVKSYNLDVRNYEELKEEIMHQTYKADCVLIGSTTINKDATPVIWDYATLLNPVVHQGKFAGVYGSYGWTGEGVDHIHQRLKSIGLKVFPCVKIKFKPNDETHEVLNSYGKNVAYSMAKCCSGFELVNDSKMTMKE